MQNCELKKGFILQNYARSTLNFFFIMLGFLIQCNSESWSWKNVVSLSSFMLMLFSPCFL